MSSQFDNILKSVSFDPGRVKTDSRKVREGDIFVAIRGTSQDGHDHIPSALDQGASFVVCESLPADLGGAFKGKLVTVSDTKDALGEILKKLYHDPFSKMKIYGVTGTNGKTTTAFLTRHILTAAGTGCGMMTTVCNVTKGDSCLDSNMTTPDITDLYRSLSEMALDEKKAAVIEISSHALSQKRIAGTELDSAVFTNISPEHLDYHKNMDSYLAEKLKIFSLLKKNGIAVINADDDMVRASIGHIRRGKVVTFSTKRKADLTAGSMDLRSSYSEFDVVSSDHGSFRVRTELVGLHNVYNILGVASSLLYTGIDKKHIKEALRDFHPVPGRLDKVGASAPFDVFVDYAHTPDALEKVLNCLRALGKRRLISVFGCGGNRDRKKRPLMGNISTSIADHTVLTSDNPRKEEPDDIIAEIKNGVSGRDNYSIIKNRKDAIRRAIEMAGEGDIVLIAGKGHENYQIIGEKVIPFNDKEVAREVLSELGF